MTTDQLAELAEIEKRANAATPGPWEYAANGDWGISTPCTDTGYSTLIVLGTDNLPSCEGECEAAITELNNGHFLANARTDVPYLLAIVRTQQAEIDKCDKAYHQQADDNDVLRAEIDRLNKIVEAGDRMAECVNASEALNDELRERFPSAKPQGEWKQTLAARDAYMALRQQGKVSHDQS